MATQVRDQLLASNDEFRRLARNIRNMLSGSIL